MPRDRSRHLKKPLSPGAFLVRNPGKSLPLMLVITLAVLLIAGIVSIMDSIPLSIRTVYGYSRFLTGATPRGDSQMVPRLKQHFAESPVPVERMVACRTVLFNVKSIVGPWPFILYGFHPEDARFITNKIPLGTLDGHLPRRGEPEAVITEPVARNLGLSIGDILLKPTDEKNYSPLPVEIVGIFDSEEWFAFTSYEYLAANHFPPIDVLMVFAKNQREQRKLDAWAEKSLRGIRAITYTYPSLERDTEETFRVLFKILNLVIALLVLVIAIMMAMLMNIYLSQRLVEFGLLQAIGFTRRKLITRTAAEAVLVVAAGWMFGVVCVYGLLSAVKALLMEPRALALDTLDPRAYLYTLAVPVVIVCAAIAAVFYRFRRFDPISVVERRIL